ncbi:MAG: hypothetical protein E7071_07165 [Bacteroidales bacterium]|nr:hypothetical protein [Bacteroidales bacterium]
MNRYILYISIAMLTACTSSKNNEIRNLSEDFPTTIELKSEVLNIPSDSLDDCEDMEIIGEWCVVKGSTGDKVTTAVNLKDGRCVKLISKGRGPNELGSNTSVTICDNSMYIANNFSYNEQELKCICISESEGEITSCPRNIKVADYLTYGPKIVLPNGYSLFNIQNNVKYTDSPYRLTVYNSLGDSICQIGDMMPLQYASESIKDIRGANWSGGYAKLHGSNRFAFASQVGVYLEFYDFKGDNKYEMLRHIYSKVHYDSRTLESGFIVKGPTDDCIYGFIDLAASDKNYFALYCGKTKAQLNTEGFNLDGNEIYSYSANGKPLKHYKLDRKVSNIAVSHNGEYLYAWSPNPETLEPEILRYKLP